MTAKTRIFFENLLLFVVPYFLSKTLNLFVSFDKNKGMCAEARSVNFEILPVYDDGMNSKQEWLGYPE